MAAFVAIAVALTLVVLGTVLRPLWRGSRAAFAGAVAVLGFATFLLYRTIGTPAGLAPAERAAPATLEQAVAELEAALRQSPNEPEGWRLLGQSYTAQKRYPEARDAYAKA
ncbi:MAG TPA: tetratricopeptide repeat protein, partial [Pseudoxanthomonas sp.]|nr:tetratricopeptide repeat protein [Pseudoxanthomonas sp.]